jgi:acetolactate synthase small subunit
MLHTFVALVQDKPGVLTRVASLFRRLNINIVSLTVGESERPDTSRMTIVCEAPETAAHRIRASLYKLEITVEVDEVGRSEGVIRELCLIKVAAGPNEPNGLHSRSQIFELANVFRARVVDLATESIMLEMTGSPAKSKASSRSCASPTTPSSKSPAPAAWPCAAACTPAGPQSPRHPQRQHHRQSRPAPQTLQRRNYSQRVPRRRGRRGLKKALETAAYHPTKGDCRWDCPGISICS